MDFFMLFQSVARWDVLGAFLATLILFGLTSLIAWRSGYRKGSRDTGLKWIYDVERNPKVIAQDIRERLEKDIAYWHAAADVYKERLREYVPLFRTTALQLSDLAEHSKALADE